MTSLLCPACAVEHATDNTGTQCTAVPKSQQVDDCPKYRPTREKLLEDALRALVVAIESTIVDLARDPAACVYPAYRRAKVLLGKPRS